MFNIKKILVIFFVTFSLLTISFFTFKYSDHKGFKPFLVTFNNNLIKINKIKIIDGNTGENYEVYDQNSIEIISNAFMQAEYKKNTNKEVATGFTYTITFYSDTNEEAFSYPITKGSIYANNTSYIIKDSFSGLIEYIDELISKE